MDGDFPDELKCPICLEIPLKEIFQCNNGHMICHKCIKQLTECPQCREKYEEKKIRCRPLENLLDTMKFDCPYKPQGCVTKVKRDQITAHFEDCKMSGNIFAFCEYFGFTCEHLINVTKVDKGLDHLVQDHDFLLRKNISKAELCLEGFLDFESGTSSFWNPVMVRNDDTQAAFIFLNVFSKKHQSLAITCLRIGPENTDNNVSVGFTIGSVDNSEDISWTTKPCHIKHAKKVIGQPSFCFSIDLLRADFIIEGAVMLTCSFINEDARMSESEVTDKIMTFNVPIMLESGLLQVTTSSSLPAQITSLNDATDVGSVPSGLQGHANNKSGDRKMEMSNFFTCMHCNRRDAGIIKCMQCPAFNFCRICGTKRVHDHHIATRLLFKNEAIDLFNKFWTPSGWRVMISASLHPSEKLPAWSSRGLVCSFPSCERANSNICFQCRPVVGCCVICYNEFLSIHSSHVLAYLKNKEELDLLLRDIPEIY